MTNYEVRERWAMKVEIRHHGRVIRGDLEYPRNRTRKLPACLLVHGFTDSRNNRWWPALSRRLEAAGYAVLRIDLNGHGKSDGEFRDFTYTRAIQDVVASVKFLQGLKRVNQHSIGAIGHSLGGTVLVLAKAPGAAMKTLVLLAPVGDTRWHYRSSATWRMVRRMKRQDTSEPTNRHVKKYLRLGPQFLRDVARHDTIRSAQSIHQPAFIVHGRRDTSAPLKESQNLFSALNEPKKLMVLPRADHVFTDQSHQRQMFREIEVWLRYYLAAKVSRVVNVYIRNNGHYLILKRSNKVGYYRGKWAIVSGHAVKGVPVTEQAFHEAREEAGLTRSQLTLVRVGKVVRRPDPELGKVWLITPVLMESNTRRVKLDWEHTAYKWVKLRDFPVKKSYPGIEKQFAALKLR